jgi:glycosyltransferase involved in cell wall biosynthesis
MQSNMEDDPALAIASRSPHVVAQWSFPAARPARLATASLRKGLTIVICTYERAASLSRFLDSLAAQRFPVMRLVIVDASSGDDVEKSLKGRANIDELGREVFYFRVAGPLRGLTRQRNFGLTHVDTDLIAFFDDDIVLTEDCLGQLNEALRAPEQAKAIAACCHIIKEAATQLPWRWKVRRLLRLYHPDQAGFYHPCGVAIPHSLATPSKGIRVVDIVLGGATCWRTSVFERCAFDENMNGYAQAEDIEFSLKTRPLGPKLLVAGARVRHLHSLAGRPSAFHYGYQCALHSAIIRDRYASVDFKHRCQYWIWQALDIALLLAAGLKRPHTVAQAFGRGYGFLCKVVRRHGHQESNAAEFC